MLSVTERHVRVFTVEIMNNEWYSGWKHQNLHKLYELNFNDIGNGISGFNSYYSGYQNIV